MNNTGKIKIGYFSAILAAIAAIVVFCVISVVFKVMPLEALPANYIGAALGSLIGALITLVLLRGQTDIEEKKGKDIRILEKKTEIFQDFIKTVWKVWEDQIITIEEFQNLTRGYYQDLMIYLKDKTRLKDIGDTLTKMGELIDKDSFEDSEKLLEHVVDIINKLSAEIDLGGEIDKGIMEGHAKKVFPVLFRKMILDALNEALDTQNIFHKGKYESIWEGRHHEFITFAFRKYPGIKLTIGEIGSNDLKMVVMADRSIQEMNEFRHQGYGGKFRQRVGEQVSVSNPVPGDEDTTHTPVLDFSKEDLMEVFRVERRNFPKILAGRVLHHIDELQIISWVEERMGKGEA